MKIIIVIIFGAISPSPNVLTTFLGLGTMSVVLVSMQFRELLDFSKNILICVPKMNGFGTT